LAALAALPADQRAALAALISPSSSSSATTPTNANAGRLDDSVPPGFEQQHKTKGGQT
jgi:hypothetical protein